jgi:hypothetical protein
MCCVGNSRFEGCMLKVCSWLIVDDRGEQSERERERGEQLTTELPNSGRKG